MLALSALCGTTCVQVSHSMLATTVASVDSVTAVEASCSGVEVDWKGK